MWTLGRSNKQAGSSSKKAADVPNLKTLELTGDLIGHSGAVQVRCHTCLQSLNIDGLTVLFLFLNRCLWASGRTVWSHAPPTTCWYCGRMDTGSHTCAASLCSRNWKRKENCDLRSLFLCLRGQLHCWLKNSVLVFAWNNNVIMFAFVPELSCGLKCLFQTNNCLYFQLGVLKQPIHTISVIC